ncbi:uncharacterized protein AMSG_04073 [Thecamonas trahens ATCC 50062]|uniref:Amidase domain-containing protein n=1 Tax=Thecamonas trahens ATCC 50062 TaxID=461836 RepID=A0A0L0D963_THETB|nr:hypothetical protein AMSG_04073 [Thecamonas trahens ATCC 50062]KNC47843.1 hypothetical protein AMSG_04073 [Thecamonas trahens ATCC 50062]|eukprot:XP_013759321.1 hypothetical protein AMSG_04073 [Thecamonas trahens ATCC 50062]
MGMDIESLARAIADRSPQHAHVSASATLEAYIAAMVAAAPLNALVADRFDQARVEASAIDAALEAGKEVGEYAGVPITVKECFAVAGMPNTSGVAARTGVRVPPGGDAPVVTALKAAGFVIMGVTNVSEACMWFESHNSVYGTTCNPYDLSRTCGGSSGGEAALVGAGASLGGVTSDVGGSTRMPAFFNGVFGLKPSPGRVPNLGQYPLGEGEIQHILSTGPVARRAADLLPLLRVMSSPTAATAAAAAPNGPLWNEWSAVEELPPLPRQLPAFDARRLRVLTCLTHPCDVPLAVTRVQPAMIGALARAAGVLQAAGASLEAREYPAFGKAFDMWSAKLALARRVPFKSHIGIPDHEWVIGHLAECVLGASLHTFPALLLALLEDIGQLMPGRTQRSAALADELGAELNAELSASSEAHDASVLLFPSFPYPAPRHKTTLFAPLDWVFTALFNVLKLPVVQVPMGIDHESRLPLGVQVVGARGSEVLLLQVAAALEAATGGWMRPSL